VTKPSLAQDQVPPHNLEAEQAVLGSALIAAQQGDIRTFLTALETLDPGDFYGTAHAVIFTALGDLHRGGHVADLVSVTDRLRQQGRLDDCGGATYLTGLLNTTFSPVTLAHHVAIVRRDAAKRALGELGGYLQHHASNGQDLDALLMFAERTLTDAREAAHSVHSSQPLGERAWTDRISGAELADDETSIEQAWLPFLRQVGVVGRGLVTLLSALGKAGKTTLLVHVVRALLLVLATLRIVWVTEEPRSLWRARVRRFPELASPDLMLVFASGRPWAQVLADLEREEADLVIIDTIRAVCGIADENDQAAVTAAIQPAIFQSRRKDWALVFAHHLRKSAADVGLGHAGSHALVGLVDVAVEMHRDSHSSARRVCKAISRFTETPSEWALELRGEEMYALGDPSVLTAAETVRRVQAVLDETPRSRQEIAALLEPQPSRGGLHNALATLVRERKASRHGRGTKGAPHRWSAAGNTFIHALSPIRERTEIGEGAG